VKSDRRKATLFGVLLILSILFGILNSVPAIEKPDYLTKLATIRIEILIAVFFQAAMAITYTIITVLMYPILRQYNESLAISYFGFRIIGSAFLFAGIATLLLLLFLSQSLVLSGQTNSPVFLTIGELLRTGRDLINHVGMILPWSTGGLILYYCFFKMNLVPKWLSIWGIVSSSLTLLSTLMLMLHFIQILTATYLIMNTPTVLFEIFLAFFLIFKGFNPNAVMKNKV